MSLEQLGIELEAARRKVAAKQMENERLQSQMIEMQRQLNKRKCCGCACSVQ
jgi:hypothetical protein